MIENQNDDELFQDLLRQIIDTEDFINEPKISIKSGSEIGDGYIGINSAIEIQSESKTLKLFAKRAPKNEIQRRQVLAKQLFDREIFFYDTIYPEFLKFQLEYNVKQPFNNVPRCYLSSKENLNEVLIFENLKEQGYELYDKTVEMNDQHILFIFKLFARFHAVSYVMKDQNYEMYSKLTANLNDFIYLFMKTTGLDVILTNLCEEAKTLFDTVENSYISNRIQNLTEAVMRSVSVTDDFIDEYSIITHGDCWCNNFLFKYKDSQDALEDVKILDWQITRVTSPVLDLSYFFYGIATKKTMAQLDFYLKTYHDSLSENIKEMGGDPEKLYPYPVFRNHWKKFSRFGLGISFLALKLTLPEVTEMPNTSESINTGETIGDVLTHKIGNDKIYKQRIKDIVEHFVCNDFL